MSGRRIKVLVTALIVALGVCAAVMTASADHENFKEVMESVFEPSK